MKKKRIVESAAVVLMTILLFVYGKESGGDIEEKAYMGSLTIKNSTSGEEFSLNKVEKPILNGAYVTEDGRYVSVHFDTGQFIEELAADMRKDFLKRHGIIDEEPFYTYYMDDKLELELWVDLKTRSGVGLVYSYGRSETEVWPDGTWIVGFSFRYEADHFQWRENKSPYDLESELNAIQREISAGDVWDYEETKEYDENGRLTLFLATGVIDFYSDETDPQDVLRVEYTYGEDGELVSRDFYRNQRIFGTGGCVQYSLYDELEREVYCSEYITHGSYGWYYLYDGDSSTPSYSLGLDYFGMPYPYFFVL